MAHDVRSLSRGFLLLANTLFGLAAAGIGVLLYVRPAAFGHYDEVRGTLTLTVRENAALEIVVVVGLLLLAFSLLWFLYGRRPKEPLRYVASHGKGGVVKVAREALEAGLRSAGEALPVVTRLRIAVESGGLKRVVVRAYFQAPDGVSIEDASRALRDALSQRFAQMVRPPDGVKTDFEIDFVGFAGKLPRRQDAEPETEPEPEAFTGPRYPIDDDDPLTSAADGR